MLHPHDALLAAARAFAVTDAFTHTYRRHRPMVERSIAWLVRGANRRLRYRGIERNRLWLGHRVAAVNLNRLVNLGLTHRADRWAIASAPTRSSGLSRRSDSTAPRRLYGTKATRSAGSTLNHRLPGRT